MRSQHISDDWCILRTAAPSTLRLAASLNAAGIEAWTPTLTVKWRGPRGGVEQERDMPILPTFVFARASHIDDLARVRTMPASPHPAFSIFHYAGRAPLVGDMQIAGLRAEEALAAVAHRQRKDRERVDAEKTERRKRITELRTTTPALANGTHAQVPHTAFTGIVGTVEQGKGRSQVLNLGGGMRLVIEAWQVELVNV